MSIDMKFTKVIKADENLEKIKNKVATSDKDYKEVKSIINAIEQKLAKIESSLASIFYDYNNVSISNQIKDNYYDLKEIHFEDLHKLDNKLIDIIYK